VQNICWIDVASLIQKYIQQGKIRFFATKKAVAIQLVATNANDFIYGILNFYRFLLMRT
jgi:hypothetical protein